ncbi:MAG: SRPBCC family protein [Gammaproteobacteria bacterium]|nr:MAG: SRPBCC family protein [Gammaproteobacteria bacterium]
MTKVSMTTQVPVSADKIWDLIGQFNALPDWHPAIEKSELEEDGQVRRLSLVGGGSIVERLEKIDEDEHLYRYSILESPLPVTDYVAELRVRPGKEGEGCTIEWSSEFDPKGASTADATEVIRGIYQAGFDNLKKLFGG